MVNSPSHYNHGGLETIDAIREALGEIGFLHFCRGNALKYIWRAGHKDNAKEDLAKAAWYCRMAAGDDPRKDKGDSTVYAESDMIWRDLTETEIKARSDAIR